MKQDVVLFIFRRDLRIEDNTALIELCNAFKNSDVELLPIFIFNPKQVDPSINKYYSSNAVEFMIETLEELNTSLKGSLKYFYGDDINILNKLLTKVNITTLSFNADVTPFARKRDFAIKEWCFKKNINCIISEDYTLFDAHSIQTDGNTPYEVYTPFYKKCIANIEQVKKPNTNKICLSIFKGPVTGEVKNIHQYYVKNDKKALQGGRSHALKILKRVKAKEFAQYDKTRDYPALDKTTKMSPYLKFGCISIREAFWACADTYGISHGLVRELMWREFYTNITLSFGHVLQGQINNHNLPMKQKYDNLTWNNNKEFLEAWKSGRTGFPIVDAAMRCLNYTGWMHNRLRMIVAMFLTKDLICDWKDGEKYFATKLIDYDPSSNNGGWQWSASTGADAQPYFRIFNPWLQSKKFDKDCKFIKKWIPELSNIANDDIHNWNAKNKNYRVNYPSPIIDHSTQTQLVKKLFTKYV